MPRRPRSHRRAPWMFTLMIVLAWPALAALQGRTDSPHTESASRVSRSFETTAPALGEPMPSSTVYNAAGEALALEQLLRGHYTVVILGCLT